MERRLLEYSDSSFSFFKSNGKNINGIMPIKQNAMGTSAVAIHEKIRAVTEKFYNNPYYLIATKK